MRKPFSIVLGLGVAALLAAQLVQPERTNPPSDPTASFEAIAAPPHQVSASLRRACGDCHSNQTNWPWYSRISPVSWFIANDVHDGRTHLNLSAWKQPGQPQETPEVGELCTEVKAGKMPPRSYTWLHSANLLSDSEIAALCALPFAEPAAATE
ncbi:MAG TPA: heme-binding domain-containing protein [Bryobacteraceae bacterium]|nr:heme-binding domain-containing protein [Bryobacteraceae bacterium]